MAVAGTTCFWIQQASQDLPAGIACIVVFSNIASFLAWRRSPVGLLQWDGAQWLWSEFGEVPVQSVSLCLDLQFFVLLQLKSATGKATWLFLEERLDRSRWLALRRAMVVQRQFSADPDAELSISAKAYI
jgi:hypothetical protein